MLHWNAGKLKNLSGTEVWLLVLARVLIGLGLGVSAVRHFPEIAAPLGLPALIAGVPLLLIAGKGLLRTHPS